MNCDVCEQPILRRYFTREFNGKKMILCPLCNKKWAEIEMHLIEEANRKAEEEENAEKAGEVTDGSGNESERSDY